MGSSIVGGEESRAKKKRLSEELVVNFGRQRRNLILISIVLVLIHSAGLKFTKLSLLGNTAELPNPNTIIYMLWLGWLYWLWRYYQYSNELGLENLFKIIKRKIQTSIPKKYCSGKIPSDLINSIYYQNYQKTDKEKIASIQFENIEILDKKVLFYSCIGNKPYIQNVKGGGSVDNSSSVEFKIGFFMMMKIRAKAVWNVCFVTSPFTEYYFPYLVALIPVITGRSFLYNTVKAALSSLLI